MSVLASQRSRKIFRAMECNSENSNAYCDEHGTFSLLPGSTPSYLLQSAIRNYFSAIWRSLTLSSLFNVCRITPISSALKLNSLMPDSSVVLIQNAPGVSVDTLAYGVTNNHSSMALAPCPPHVQSKKFAAILQGQFPRMEHGAKAIHQHSRKRTLWF